MSKSLMILLRVMQNLVTGPRDWYEIRHCKTGKGKPYFGVRICVWRGDWPVYGDGESVHLVMAIQEAIGVIEEEVSPPVKADAPCGTRGETGKTIAGLDKPGGTLVSWTCPDCQPAKDRT